MINKLYLFFIIICVIFMGEIAGGNCPAKGRCIDSVSPIFDTSLNDTIMKEIWKDVPGYVGNYMASNYGRIKSMRRRVIRNTKTPHILPVPGGIKKLSKHSSGYLRVPLCKNGVVKYHYVHNIISLAFLGIKPDGYDVDHIDHNRTNNKIDNLRYITIKLNRGIPGNKHGLKKRLP